VKRILALLTVLAAAGTVRRMRRREVWHSAADHPQGP